MSNQQDITNFKLFFNFVERERGERDYYMFADSDYIIIKAQISSVFYVFNYY